MLYASGVAHAGKPAGFVLCGGRSSRMGRDKALLDFRGRPLVAHVAGILHPLCSEVCLVAGSAAPYSQCGYPVLVDEYPGEGPLGGLLTALGLGAAPWNLVVSCDLAGIEPEPLAALVELAVESDARAILPRSASGPEPLHGIYSTSLLDDLRRLWAGGERGLVRALSSVTGVKVIPAADLDAGPHQFLNINTAEEWLIFRGGEKV